MRKFLYTIFVAIIIALAVLPFAGQLFLAKDTDDNNSEQRDLAEMPTLVVDGKLNLTFTKGLDDYFSDHFAMRQELVNAFANIKHAIFNVSPNEKITCGSNGFLYFSETIADYTGENADKIAEIDRIATIIELEEAYVKSLGGKYVFTVAPNKNTIYPEYMPKRYIAAEADTLLDKLAKELLARGVNYVDLKTHLIENKSDDLYFKQDSHWNLLGARIAYREILKAAGIEEMGDFGEAVFFEEEREDDLRKMLFPLDPAKAETNANWNVEKTYQYIGKYRGPDDLTIETTGEKTNVSIVMHRDSFGRALIPMFSEEAGSATYLRALPFNIYKNAKDTTTLVINEIVERNILTLLDRSPVVPSMSCSFDKLEASTTSIAATKENSVFLTKSDNGLSMLYGFVKVDANMVKSGYRVYATFGGGCFEGFPVYESSLAEDYGEETADKAGFAFRFDENIEFFLDMGDVNVYIVPTGR